MKKVIFIFIMGITIGLLFIGGNILKGKNVSSYKNNVDMPNISDRFFASSSTQYVLLNVDENYNPINNSEFKITPWNGKNSIYSSYKGNGAYLFDENTNLNFNEAWDYLNDYQKNKVENISTFKDLYDTFYAKYNYPRGYGYCFKDSYGSLCEGATLVSYAVLEQTNISYGYTKQKYIVPIIIYLGFSLEDYSIYDDGPIYNVSNDARVKLYYIEIGIGGSPDGLILLKYDDYSSIIKKYVEDSNFDLEGFVYDNRVFYDNFCSDILPNHFSQQERREDKIFGNRFNKIQGYYSFDYCTPTVVNKRGSVNISINTTVNEKTSLSTSSNSKLLYKVSIVNGGLTSFDNKVVSKLPEGFQYVDGSASNGGIYNSSDNTITWTLMRLDEDSYINLTYEAYAPNNMSSIKDYVSEASIESSSLQNKIVSNKATVKLMANPKTNAPLYGIGITLIIVWGIAFYLYFDKRKKEVLQK